MQFRESRLLIVTAALGLLAVQPLACGGSDDNSSGNNNNGSNNNGSNNGGNNNNTTSGTPCQRIQAKFTSCATSTCPTSDFTAYCQQDGTFTADDATAWESATCADVVGIWCGDCPSGQTCTAGIETGDGLCLGSGLSVPSGSQDCTATGKCNDPFAVCVPITSTTSSCITTCTIFFTQGTCGKNLTCSIQGNDYAYCLDPTTVIPGTASSCTTYNDCASNEDCVPYQGNKYCVGMCAPPACPSSTVCQYGDSAGDTLCLDSSGNVPSDAPDCTTGDDCQINFGCNTKIGKCVQFCFAE